jgi:hypothetical protein
MKTKNLHTHLTKPPVTAEWVRSILIYDPETGEFRWRTDGWGERPHKAGARAEKKASAGYLKIWARGHQLTAHRVAWLYVYGEFPAGQIDHINGVKTDNRMSNLRDVTPRVNSENKRSAYRNNTSGLMGVTPDPSGRYMARIFVKGKRRFLGMHDTPELAHLAYIKAKRELHEGCTV